MTVGSVTMRHSDNVVRRDISKNAVMPIPARIRARYALAMSLLTYHVKSRLRTIMMCVMCLHNIVYEHFSGLRNLFTRHNGFKIGCLNIRGLLNKINEMKTIVTECNFDIMGICEPF